MGTYWERKGPRQEEYLRLRYALIGDDFSYDVPDTTEGWLLLAAERVAHEFYNNGGGNNVSGAFYYLRQHLPYFKVEWSEALIPFVTGSGGIFCSNEQLVAVEEILDTAVQYVISREGNYQHGARPFFDLDVKETGFEISQWDAQCRQEDRIDAGPEGPVEPNFETMEMRP